MRKFIVIVFITNILLFAQTSKLEKLEWIKSRGDIKVTDEGNDIYRLEYPGGSTLHFNFGKTEASQTDSIPTTVIETWNIDTMLYKDMYYFWQEVPVTTATGYELIIGDMNENGFSEIYGRTRDYEDPWSMPMRVYELNAENNFDYIMIFSDSLVLAKEIYDVKSSGKNNLILTSLAGNAIFYNNIPVDPFTLLNDFVYYRYHISYPGQMDHPELGDFDSNGETDLLFYDFTGRSVIICEYDANINNFNLVKEFHYSTGFYSGFATGDFDMDGKTDFVYGGIDGEVFVVEAEGEHSYTQVWESEVEISNAYWQIFTNDIDGNGKPEFWVASTTYYGFIDVTRYTCFEYTGDNEYQEKHRIDFVGAYPLYAMNGFACDADNDGTEELVLCIGDIVFIIKCKGSVEPPVYEIFYMTKRSIPGAFTGVTMYDFDVNGYEELLIHMSITRSDGKSKRTTYLFKSDFVVPVLDENESKISGYSLEQNYPNPFNSATTISYNLPKDSYISLKVFDILGNEVTIIDEGERIKGKHKVHWDGKDKFQREVNSGIYFIHLSTPFYKKTIKGVMLK
jgi:hypothetical protein